MGIIAYPTSVLLNVLNKDFITDRLIAIHGWVYQEANNKAYTLRQTKKISLICNSFAFRYSFFSPSLQNCYLHLIKNSLMLSPFFSLSTTLWMDMNYEWMIIKLLSQERKGQKHPDEYLQNHLIRCAFLCDWILKLRGKQLSIIVDWQHMYLGTEK